MKPFTFLHLADCHLGYLQYNLEARRSDFSRALEEVVEKAEELKPDYVFIAGDLFHHPRPTNPTLAEAIACLRTLRDRGAKLFAVDGSHDTAPNIVTGTILSPLDEAGLLCYLPVHGQAWSDDRLYIYGVPSLRAGRSLKDVLSVNPSPKRDRFNVFLFHGAVDHPEIRQRIMQADFAVAEIPQGFDYYAGGHIHEPCSVKLGGGILAYSGCLETTSYSEAQLEKGFFYGEVREDGSFDLERIPLERLRRFVVLEHDFSGAGPEEIVRRSIDLVRRADEPESILVLVLKGQLPARAKKASVDLVKIKRAAKKALYLHVVNRLEEAGIREELKETLSRTERDFRIQAYDYLLRIFSERFDRERAEKLAKAALDLIHPLLRGKEEAVREILESLG